MGKILRLKKALEYDPKFVDAYLELGRAYRADQDPETAQSFFLKGYTVRLSEISNERKSKILYEMAETYGLLSKTAAREDALRGARKLSTDSALRREITLELGELLFKENRFDEALREFNKVSLNDHERRNYYSGLIRAASNSLELNQFYKQASQAELDDHPTRALKLFRQIQLKQASFRDTNERISGLTRDLARNEKPRPDTSSTSLATEPVSKSPEIAVESAKPEENAQSSASRNKAAAEQPDRQAVFSAPKKAAPRITSSQKPERVIRAAPTVPVAERPQLNDSTFSKTRQRQPAIQKEKISPANAVVSQREVVSKNDSRKLGRSKNTGAGSTKKGDLKTKPSRAGLAKKNVNKAAAKEISYSRSKSKALFVATLLCGFVLVGAFVIRIIAPERRARLLTLLSLYGLSIEIYERMLVKDAKQLWIYPRLARLFHICDRRDERAMEVYKKIQGIKSDFGARYNLNEIVRNKYLAESSGSTFIPDNKANRNGRQAKINLKK